jgi:medium-chain acyl-[acyl-carrier-protein] hydrolase
MNTENPAHWIETIKVSLYEVDYLNKLRVDSIFNYLQDAASNHAETLGWGYNNLIKENLTWILYRVKLIINNYKGMGDTIRIDTWPKGVDGLLALRDFKLFDENENIFALASSGWLLVDSNTMRPVKSEKLYKRINHVYLDSENAIIETPGKINAPENIEKIRERIIMYTDIDVNNHVNNAKYVEFALDCFSTEEFAIKEIKSIHINFLSELKYGDKVTISKCWLNNSNQAIIMGVKNDSNEAFQSIICWE